MGREGPPLACAGQKAGEAGASPLPGRRRAVGGSLRKQKMKRACFV